MYLGIDLGTSGIKLALMDETAEVFATTTAPLTVERPSAQWSEQDPDQWIGATRRAFADLRRSADLSDVKAIGLSGQMHGATLLDASDRPLRPSILWNDTRSATQAKRLDADPIFRAKTGSIVFPGFTAPKLAWVKENEPDVFAQTRRVVLPKDYLRLWLTGETVSDMSDASGTGWLDVGSRAWSDELLARTDLPLAAMPRLVEGSDVSGYVRPSIATVLGLSTAHPIAVAGGGGDNAATAVGLNVTAPGQGFLSLGTSGVIFAASDHHSPQPETAVHAFCHALPNTWHSMSVMLSASDCLSWFATTQKTAVTSLLKELPSVLNIDPSLQFLPYLGGERTPHNDAKLRAGFAGLSHASDRTAMTTAVLAGVAYGLRDNLDALRASGMRIERLVVAGGGSRSTAWLQLIATILNCPLDVPADASVGAALGAGKLAQMAYSGTAIETVPIKISAAILPQLEQREIAEAGLEKFRALTRALQPLC